MLRHPAGLNDTLVDLINTCTLADMAPTAQAEAVSREVMAKSTGSLRSWTRWWRATSPRLNKAASEQGVPYVAMMAM